MVLPESDPLHVAIDGPAGSGKSSVARAVAQALGLAHVDTGAMYRALTWTAMNEGLSLEDGPGLAARLRRLDLEFRDGRLRVDGIVVGDQIREPVSDENVSSVSALPELRAAMQERQRAFGWSGGGVVMEGRDIGSVVLPMARCKIFLTASVEERARRRAKQAGRGSTPAVITEVAAELGERDRLDSTRQHSPLRLMPDANLVDNSTLDRDQTIARILDIAGGVGLDEPSATAHFWMRHYKFGHDRIAAMMRRSFSVEVHGAGNQTGIRGGAVFACNHIAGWDPLLLGAMIDRQVAFLAKDELFRWPLGPLVRWVGTVPIVRGRYDAGAFQITRDHLRSGRNVAIFPEGTRRPPGRPGPVKRGLGILVGSAGAPWVPCMVRGTASARRARDPRFPMELWIGPPSYPSGIGALRAAGLQDAAIQARIGELYLAQIQALMQRAQEHRPRADHEASAS
jgi:cytidylate kinase